MDWETLYCPNHDCRSYGKPFAQGYLVKNGTSRGQPRAWCKACEASVVLSDGMAYDGLEAESAIFETAVRALAEGNAIRATARIVHVAKDTVCAWLHRVACPCRTVLLSFWHDLHVSECQLDALWSFVGSVAKFDFWGKIQKSCIRNTMSYRLPNSRKSNFATEPSCVPLLWMRGAADAAWVVAKG
jgi:hypothetical protein